MDNQSSLITRTWLGRAPGKALLVLPCGGGDRESLRLVVRLEDGAFFSFTGPAAEGSVGKIALDIFGEDDAGEKDGTITYDAYGAY